MTFEHPLQKWAGHGEPRFRIAVSVRNAAGHYKFLKNELKALI
jgi:hypothetical protein